MLRGSSRHDGIPNKQSARERDRDRLRERQRQERQQMLPNDDKDISVGAQDLFHAPVKVKPSVDDTTTAQIANTLGNFDQVRHLILDTSNRRSVNLIGVDQGSLPGTPIAIRPPQVLASGQSGEPSNKLYFHSQSGQSSSGSATSELNKPHSRNLFNTSTNLSNNIVINIAGVINNNFGINNSVSTLSTSSASSDYNYPAAANFRGSNPGVKGASHSQPPQPQNNNSSTTTNNNNNNSSNHSSAPPLLPTTASQVTAAVGGSSSSSSSFNTNNNSSNNNSITNLNSSAYTNSASNNNQVRQPSSFNNTSSAPSTVTDVSVEGSVNAASAPTNALATKETQDCASGADDKKNASSNKKPSLERADSQLELESMLKEMINVSTPVTAIQTPNKEIPAKKPPPRRSSKSEEKIVQSIRDSGMADVPSPVQGMDSSDSSSSYDTETSDSESEDSSSGSQAGEKIEPPPPKVTPNTHSPTRWNLSSFIRKNDYRGTPNDTNATTPLGGSKSPKDTKPNAHQVNAINSETSPGDTPVKVEPVVSSTSLLNKAQSLSPLDTPPAPAPPPRKITRSSAEVKTEPHVPPKPPPVTANTKAANAKAANAKTPNSKAATTKTPNAKTTNAKTATTKASTPPVAKSASASKNDGDGDKGKKEGGRTAPPVEDKTTTPGAGKRKRKRSPSVPEKSAPPVKQEPEEKKQDRNKNESIRRLFLTTHKKVDSPTRSDSGGDVGKSPGAPSTNGTGASNNSGAGSSAASFAPPPTPATPAGGSSGSSNRVQAKDSGSKKSKDKDKGKDTTSSGHNGESSGGGSTTEPPSKKRDDGAKEKESRSSHGSKKKSTLSIPPTPGSSTSKLCNSIIAPLLAPPSAKIKVEPGGQLDKGLSSLVVKINLNKLKRKPNMMPAPPPPPHPTHTPLAPPPPPPPIVPKGEKDSTDKGGKGGKEPAANPNNADLFAKRVHHNSSRVGSSSDHAKDAKEPPGVAHNPPPGRPPPELSLCSEPDMRGKKRSKSKKTKSSSNSSSTSSSSTLMTTTTTTTTTTTSSSPSPKKSKLKHEPDSHSKVEEETACTEVSSNVLGYSSCDSVSVSTTRTPPVESDVVQAPDSSLNPPHLPSPVVPPQPIYFSYFEKSDHLEDYYARRDQDSYLEEAKRLKHKADGERVGTSQASMYLEAGLYFILTGISMERDRTVGSTAAFTMYKDTLVLIRYIGSRFRNRGIEFANPMEAKIIVLSMRCQSLLSLKLYKIKLRETKEMLQYLQEHFQRHPTLDMPPVINSPQLSTPSPHSPTSSPAASSSLHPSPHHPNQITVPRTLYSNMQKTCGSATHLISAHELWEAADHLVEKYRVEDFFIQLDRQFGPLTLHNTLVDLVRYVKQALQILKSSSELS